MDSFTKIVTSIRHAKSYNIASLQRDSVLYVGSSLIIAVSGFFFWFMVANIYQSTSVGRASAIISLMSLVSLFAVVGLDMAVIRYAQTDADMSGLVNSVLIFALGTSLVCVSLFFFVHLVVLPFEVLTGSRALIVLFGTFIVFKTIEAIIREGVFIGYQCSVCVLAHSFTSFIQIFVVVFLTQFGALGIFASYGLTTVMGSVVGLALMSRRFTGYTLYPTFNVSVIRDLFSFSMKNYVARVSEELPTVTFPLLVIATIGPSATAYFYIAWHIALLVFTVPRFTSLAVIPESVRAGTTLVDNLKTAAKIIVPLLAVATLFVVAGGRFLLSLFGAEYAANAYWTLVLLTLSAFPYAVNSLIASVERVRERSTVVIVIYGSVYLGTIVGGLLTAEHWGIDGIAASWFASNVILSVLALVWIQRRYR